MKKQIELRERKVEYTLKVSRRARRMRLAVYRDGSFVVTVPQNMSESAVERFIMEKSRWVVDKLAYFKGISGRVFAGGVKKDYTEHKDRALAFARERIEYFNRIYGFSFNKINIKNQKSRWGSCSKKGNLNFNYKIVLLPERLADYIIVHELCHLEAFNHSQKFWDLVAMAAPDYLGVKKELNKVRVLK